MNNEPASLRCAAHPGVETQLKCGKCGKPICPKCLVQTPVGSRCRECARLYKLPTYRVTPVYYLRAAGTALVLAVVLGLAWGFIGDFVPFIFLNLLVAAGIGWVIGEVTGLAINRKRGIWLAVIGGAGVAVCYVVNIFTFGGLPAIGLGLAVDVAGVVIGITTAVSRLR
jgi:hypothetical protein